MKTTVAGRKAKAKHPAVPPQTTKAIPRGLLAMAALSALTVLAFSNCFQSPFILDNRGLLIDPRIRELTADNLALIWRHTYWWPNGESGLYRPFTTLSYLFNYAMLGDTDQPPGYHIINLLLHIGNVWLAYMLAVKALRRFWPAVFLAALWAVHPALTESVTNIVGRADLLAGMSVLAGLLLYSKSAESGVRSAAIWVSALAVVATMGVFSKESAVAILPLIVLFELVYSNVRLRRKALALGCAATALPIAVMLYVRATVLAASPPAEFPFTDNPIAGADWWTGRLTAIKVMAHYVVVTLWPAQLSCDYSYNQIPLSRGTVTDWLLCALAAGLVTALVPLYRWSKDCFFLACFAIINFLPASNLFFPIGTIMADRLLYLPSFGLLGCLVLVVYAICRRPPLARVPPVLLCLIVVLFAARTFTRNRDWQSELAIATADLHTSPYSFKLHRLLASSLFESDATHSNIDQVIAEQEKSLALLDPLPPALSRPDAYRQAGYYQLVKGRATKDAAAFQIAIQYLRRGIAIDEAGRTRYHSLAAGDAQAYLLLSIGYLESGDADKALEAARRAKALDPLDSRIYRQLSGVYATKGMRTESETAAALEDSITALQRENWEQAADLSASVMRSNAGDYPAAYYFNAMANLHLGKLDAAESSARAAVEIMRTPQASQLLALVLRQKK